MLLNLGRVKSFSCGVLIDDLLKGICNITILFITKPFSTWNLKLLLELLNVENSYVDFMDISVLFPVIMYYFLHTCHFLLISYHVKGRS